ncbi:hypothetical protein ACFLWK_00245 [Chloroflexota bacterium]
MKRKIVFSILLPVFLVIALCSPAWAYISGDDGNGHDGGHDGGDDGESHDDADDDDDVHYDIVEPIEVFGGANLQDLQVAPAAPMVSPGPEGGMLLDENGNPVQAQRVLDENGRPLGGPNGSFMYYLNGVIIYIAYNQTTIPSQPAVEEAFTRRDSDRDQSPSPPDEPTPPDAPLPTDNPAPEISEPPQQVWSGAYGSRQRLQTLSRDLNVGQEQPVRWQIGEPAVDTKGNPIMGRPVLDSRGIQARNSQGWPVWVITQITEGARVSRGEREPRPPEFGRPDFSVPRPVWERERYWGEVVR